MTLPSRGSVAFVKGNAHDLLEGLPDSSVSCVVTSTPYWGTRIYDYSEDVSWADGETCPFVTNSPEGTCPAFGGNALEVEACPQEQWFHLVEPNGYI